VSEERLAQDRAWRAAMGRQTGVSLAPPAAAAAPAAPVVQMPVRESSLPPLRDDQVHVGEATIGGPVGVDLARLIEGRLLIQGNSGAGKSMLLRRLFEEAFGKVQQLLVDPEGEFGSLAETLDVAVVTAAELGRIGGEAFGLHAREHRYSAVVDLSEADNEERLGLVADLMAGLLAAPEDHWRPLLVVCDEVQELAPHYDAGDVTREARRRATAGLARMMGRGRKRGIAGVLATQRIAETAKSVIAKATNVIVGRTILDRDLERAGELLGLTAGHAKALRTLADGEFLGIGPAIAGPRRIRFKAALPRSPHRGKAPELTAPPAIAAAAAIALLGEVPAADPGDVARPGPTVAVHGNRRNWDPKEDGIVSEGYRSGKTIAEIADALEAAGFRRRSMGNISTRGASLGLVNARAARVWTEEEDAMVVACYRDGVPIRDMPERLAALGSTRTRGAIQMRAINLGITTDRVRYWTGEEEKIALAALEDGKTNREIIAELKAAGFERGVTAISKFAQKHGVDRSLEPWSEEELALLRARYGEKVAVKDIAAELGKTRSAVAAKASILGLKQRVKWSDAEYQMLHRLQASGATLGQAAEQIGRPYPNVARVAATLQLDFRRNRESVGLRRNNRGGASPGAAAGGTGASVGLSKHG